MRQVSYLEFRLQHIDIKFYIGGGGGSAGKMLSQDDCFEVATADETVECQNNLEGLLGEVGEVYETTVGYQSGTEEADILWFEEYKLWYCPDDGENRYWNAFGIEESSDDFSKGSRNIVCEINPPYDPNNNRTSGRFLKDGRGDYYLAHLGRFNNKSKKIYLRDDGSWRRVQICNRGQQAFIVSKLDDENLLSNLARFVHEVKKMKEEGSGYMANNEQVYDTPDSQNVEMGGYTIDSIIKDGCFVEKEKLEDAMEILKRKKNLIFQGPPGTGKTWLGKRMAYALRGEKPNEPQEYVKSFQFHPNISYEDFIRGYRPSGVNGSTGLELVDGQFLKMVMRAQEEPDQKHVIIIEEINRGNPANIFGEMLTLLEVDKRNESEALKLGYGDDEPIYIPDNLYVIGTMNVADRSIAMVDMALRRRFGFVTLNPLFNEKWKRVVKKCGVSDDFAKEIKQKIESLNKIICDDSLLGSHFQIGHSYLMPPNEGVKDARGWFKQVVENEIVPLLEEYWPQNVKKVEGQKKSLLKVTE